MAKRIREKAELLKQNNPPSIKGAFVFLIFLSLPLSEASCLPPATPSTLLAPSQAAVTKPSCAFCSDMDVNPPAFHLTAATPEALS